MEESKKQVYASPLEEEMVSKSEDVIEAMWDAIERTNAYMYDRKIDEAYRAKLNELYERKVDVAESVFATERRSLFSDKEIMDLFLTAFG